MQLVNSHEKFRKNKSFFAEIMIMCDIMKRKCCVELTISILQITRKKYGRKLQEIMD